MISVEQIAAEIVRREGGFVDDPDDPGGATKHGVTIGTLKALRRDLDGDGDTDVADIRALTESDAAAIFLAEYFRKPFLYRLPVPLQAPVFDMQVNAGPRSVRLLQELLNARGYGPLAEDGRCGPATARAAMLALVELGPALVDAYGAARRDYYYRVGDARPASRKYVRRRDGGKGGWITRAEDFMSEAARLSDAEHRARTAHW